MRSYLVEVAFEVAVEVVVVGRHAGFTAGAKLLDREHVVVRRLVSCSFESFFKNFFKKKDENTFQNSARMVRFGIAIEPREPIFKNIIIFEKKEGC